MPSVESRVVEALERAHTYQVLRANEAKFEVISHEGTNIVDIRNQAIYQIMSEKSINSKFVVTVEKIPFLWFGLKKILNLWFGLTGLTFFGAISPVGVAKWPLGIF